MMRTMLWKEYREHRLIWLVMMVVNCGILIGVLKLSEIAGLPLGEGNLTLLGPTAALLIWGYGMICGAMLLAGEREEGTLIFLDTLPVSRLRLWLVKGRIGLIFLVGQIIVLYGFLAILRAVENAFLMDHSQPVWPYVLGMLALGLVGMAYGLFFSARGENVLHTIGLAVLGQIIAWIAVAFLGFILSILVHILDKWFAEGRTPGPILRSIMEGPIVIFSVFGGLTLAAVVGSARIFSRTDRERRPVVVRRMRGRDSIVASCLRIVWLCYRQMGRLALGVLAFSLGLGVLFLIVGPLLWPVATLCLGVLCGVTVFSDEQTLGSFRFLGDQRFPLGRIWFIKTGMRFGLLLLASFLIVLPFIGVGVSYGIVQQRETPLIHEMPYFWLINGGLTPLPSFLLMWLLYGFSAGQLCGLLSRKSIVAAMIALMASAMLAVVWLPSLVGCGLHFWQVAGPPLIFLTTTAFLMRSWAADRLGSRMTYLGISTATIASLVWIAFGLWYRVIEVPDVPEPFDVAAYTASLPQLEENEAGQLLRHLWGQVETMVQDLHGTRSKTQPMQNLYRELNQLLSDGWQAGQSELGDWMDREFAQEWLRELALLPDLPLGMVADPRLLNLIDLDKESHRWDFAVDLSSLLAARGLQQQTRGKPGVFVEHMRIALALSRNLRHSPITGPPLIIGRSVIGRSVARVWTTAMDLWLKKLYGRPDLLRRALQILIDHEANLPTDELEEFQSTYLVLRNTLTQAPEELLRRGVPHLHETKAKERETAELQTVTLLWLIPWEQERHQRLLRLAFRISDRDVRKLLDWGGPPFADLEFFLSREMRGRNRHRRELAALRACQLKVALRLYQEENGELPASLEALTPHYVPSVPRDPFDSRSFRYRRSRGEWIAWPETIPPNPKDASQVPPMPSEDGVVRLPRPPRMQGGGMIPGGIPGLVEEWVAPGEVVPPMPRSDGGPPPKQRLLRANAVVLAEDPLSWLFVPEGQGILWSVGEDLHDDGGVEQGMNTGNSSLGQDLIYLVPPP